MARLTKPETPSIDPNQKYVTLIGDIVLDKTWVIPSEYRVPETSPNTDTGLIQLNDNGEPLMISRSGINIGVREEKLSFIIDQLSEQGYTHNFKILETGTNIGDEPEHYSYQDYLVLQSKILASPYLKKCNPNLTKQHPETV